MVCLWALVVNGDEPLSQRVLPDACADLVCFEHRPAVVAGAATRAYVVHLPARATVVGVRFYPGAASRWLNTPASVFRDRLVEVEQFGDAHVPRRVDLEAGALRLDPGHTKGGEGRDVFLPPALVESLRAQRERVRALERAQGRIIPWVFPHLAGRERAGARIQDFRRAWATACRRAGAPGMLRHDFRRTAVRNMVNDGTPEKVAMAITGHRTRSIFDRYHIVAPEDLRAAAARMAQRETRPADASGRTRQHAEG